MSTEQSDTEDTKNPRRGRKPSGVKLVDKFDGSDLAKERLKVILHTISGELSVVDACETLCVNEAAFYKLRERFLSESVDLLEPRKVGRKQQMPDERSQRIDSLEEEVRDLKFEVEATRVRAQIAMTMPELLVSDDETTAEDIKKKERSGLRGRKRSKRLDGRKAKNRKKRRS